MADGRAEIAAGKRFAFGSNWKSFVELVDDGRIGIARQSLTGTLGVTDLSGRRFLDIGCGSGLFSLAAHQLGACVHSFDFDPDSVATAAELRRRFGTELPAILITADRSLHVREEAQAEGVHLLHKPLKPASLRALITQWRVQRVAAE